MSALLALQEVTGTGALPGMNLRCFGGTAVVQEMPQSRGKAEAAPYCCLPLTSVHLRGVKWEHMEPLCCHSSFRGCRQLSLNLGGMLVRKQSHPRPPDLVSSQKYPQCIRCFILFSRRLLKKWFSDWFLKQALPPSPWKRYLEAALSRLSGGFLQSLGN